MRNVTTKLLNTESTSQRLRNKIELCGVMTHSGYQNFCRSCACDTCRRHRSKVIARAIYNWASPRSSSVLRSTRISTATCSTPSALIDEINDTRARLRRALDRHGRDDARWASVRAQGVFRPAYDADAGSWTATCFGLVDFGTVGEIRFLNGLDQLVHVRLKRVPEVLLLQDVLNHIAAGMSVNGLSGCSDDDLASLYGYLERRGEYKALVYRRGVSRR